MRIYEDVFERIISSYPSVPPENGGILGIQNDIVCEYLHDTSIQLNDANLYCPDISWMNDSIKVWSQRGIAFGGIVHSHPSDQRNLSNEDKVYITKIMKSLSQTIEKLFFPIVIPFREVIVFVAESNSSGISILKDEIIVIKR